MTRCCASKIVREIQMNYHDTCVETTTIKKQKRTSTCEGVEKVDS